MKQNTTGGGQNGNEQDSIIFFFNDTATTEIYTLSLHDALPISRPGRARRPSAPSCPPGRRTSPPTITSTTRGMRRRCGSDRKSTRLNSSHANISYAVFCLKKKKKTLSHSHHLHSSLAYLLVIHY